MIYRKVHNQYLRSMWAYLPNNKSIFLNENVKILIKILLTIVPNDLINNIPALVQATSHYLDQWWLVSWSIHASLGLNELILLQSGLPRCIDIVNIDMWYINIKHYFHTIDMFLLVTLDRETIQFVSIYLRWVWFVVDITRTKCEKYSRVEPPATM